MDGVGGVICFSLAIAIGIYQGIQNCKNSTIRDGEYQGLFDYFLNG
jgi:hypothetical protein